VKIYKILLIFVKMAKPERQKVASQ